VITLRKTAAFAKWIDELRDIRARARIQVRIERLATGRRGSELIVLLVGDRQKRNAADIKRAIELARTL
jgi:putative component of toxin-antitoxin plasmid stabilization module